MEGSLYIDNCLRRQKAEHHIQYFPWEKQKHRLSDLRSNLRLRLRNLPFVSSSLLSSLLQRCFDTICPGRVWHSNSSTISPLKKGNDVFKNLAQKE